MKEENENTNLEVEITNENNNMKKSGKKVLWIIIFFILLVAIIGTILWVTVFSKEKNNNESHDNEVNNNIKYSTYTIKNNSLQDFDLYFMQLENKDINKVYSPLSIKYALQMLSDGSAGNTKKEIDSILGEYSTKGYENSSNMSFANAMFIRNDLKDYVKTSYIDSLKNNYRAEIFYDEFKSSDYINNWVSEKTFKMIPKLFDNVSDLNFALVNALAIDMEWNNKIQSRDENYSVSFKHEKYGKYINKLEFADYSNITFNGKKDRKAVEIGAVANKYDLVSTIGEKKVRETIISEYKKWLNGSDSCGSQDNYDDDEIKKIADDYIKEINKNYGHLSSSTDFLFEDTNEIKVFAKDMKKYNDTTLQYIGIMPKKEKLSEFVKNTNAKKINTIINDMKDIQLDSFKDGVITEIKGYIPTFNFDYELDLKNDLKSLGIKDVFEPTKADLSAMVNEKREYIDVAVHKANVDFSNDKIKAAAATAFGGKELSSLCYFDYSFDVPTEVIDLTFDKPFMFIIRDKNSGEVWFTGTVYDVQKWESIFSDKQS